MRAFIRKPEIAKCSCFPDIDHGFLNFRMRLPGIRICTCRYQLYCYSWFLKRLIMIIQLVIGPTPRPYSFQPPFEHSGHAKPEQWKHHANRIALNQCVPILLICRLVQVDLHLLQYQPLTKLDLTFRDVSQPTRRYVQPLLHLP